MIMSLLTRSSNLTFVILYYSNLFYFQIEVKSCLLGYAFILGIFQFFFGCGAHPPIQSFIKDSKQTQINKQLSSHRTLNKSRQYCLMFFVVQNKKYQTYMGTNICSPQISQVDNQYTPLSFAYGEDQFYAKIVHEDTITCRTSQIEKVLDDCQNKLRVTQRLYKDPTMNTDPIILRSLSKDKEEVKCTFERPHVFLNDPSDPVRNKYKKYKILDIADNRPSQIIIRDQVMQPFGILLCFLAEHPNIINTIILTDSNSYGICVIQMNLESKKQYIYIDDYILCADKSPLFAQPVRGIYMWPCLLQKAWFKAKGYMTRKIEKKSPIEIIKSFLSFPIKTFLLAAGKQENESFKLYNETLLKKFLHNQQEDRSIIVTSRVEPTHKIGISGRKHFYLLKVITFTGKKLYYMRNPYTSFDFRGSYRILPQELTTLIKKETGDLRIHEGNFVLDEQEFLEQIESFSIIYFNKSSQIVSEESIELAINEDFYMSVDLKQDGSTSFSFNQSSFSNEQNQYLPFSFHVVSLNDNQLVSQHDNDGACFGQQSTMFFQNIYKPLKAGQYLIRLKKKFKDLKAIKKLSLIDRIVVTSSAKVRFDYKQPQLLSKHFRKFILQIGKKKLQQKRLNEKELLTNSGVEYAVFWIGDLAVIYFEKTNMNKKEIRVEVKFQKMSNLECLTHKVGTNYLALKPIIQNQIMIFQKIVLSQAANLGAFSMQPY